MIAEHTDPSGWVLRLWRVRATMRVHLEPPPRWTVGGYRRLRRLIDELSGMYPDAAAIALPQGATRGYRRLVSAGGLRAVHAAYVDGEVVTQYRRSVQA